MRRPLIALVLLSFAPLLCAQAYKWKDAAGTVHYSETPPPAGTKYSRVTVTGSAEPAVAASSPPPAAAPAMAQADTPANRDKLCGNLQHNLEQLQGDAALNMDDGNGHVTAMDATRRQQELASEQAQYQQYCRGK